LKEKKKKKKKKMMTCVLQILSFALVFVNAHVCMLQPMQRGGVTAAINTAAAPECAWLSGPCGNTTWHAPSLQIRPVSPV
jgi:hypothetical protein